MVDFIPVTLCTLPVKEMCLFFAIHVTDIVFKTLNTIIVHHFITCPADTFQGVLLIHITVFLNKLKHRAFNQG